MSETEATAGVPVIAPVEVLRTKPDGRDGEIEKTTGVVPLEY